MFRTSFPLPVFFLLYFVFFIYFIFLICCRWVSECWSTLQPRLPFVELLWCQSRDHHQVVFKVQKQRWCYVKKKKKILFSLSDVFPQKQRRRQSRLKRERKSKHFLIILKRRQTHTPSLIHWATVDGAVTPGLVMWPVSGQSVEQCDWVHLRSWSFGDRKQPRSWWSVEWAPSSSVDSTMVHTVELGRHGNKKHQKNLVRWSSDA